jgi:hypothetical protein
VQGLLDLCFLTKQLIAKICTGHSWAILSRVNRRRKSLWLVSARQSLHQSSRKEELKENIHKEIANIPAAQLQRINQNLFCQCEEMSYV